jgi:GNAT superfamily N-acetyltransferase
VTPPLTNKPIRQATIADAQEIASLVERYWAFESLEGFDRGRVVAVLVKLLSEPALGACWIAEVDGQLCGYLIAVFMLSLEHGGLMAEIDEFYVSADNQSLGLGTSLLRRAEAEMKQRGFIRLQLQLGIDNERGREFYERHGFASRSGYQLLDKPL